MNEASPDRLVRRPIVTGITSRARGVCPGFPAGQHHVLVELAGTRAGRHLVGLWQFFCRPAGRSGISAVLALVLVVTVQDGACAAETADGQFAQAFFKSHCTGCHNPKKTKGSLDLKALEQSLAQPGKLDARTMTRWEHVFDRVAREEMPPADEEQPTIADRQAFLARLAPLVAGRSRARQQADGRTPLRRLNQVEYENTIRDLLSLPALNVAGVLPQDGRSADFDNIAAELGVSPLHLLRYQEAANVALMAAVPRHSFEPLKFAMTGEEIKTLRKHVPMYGTGIRLNLGQREKEGDSGFIPITTADGMYRIRILGYGLVTNTKAYMISTATGVPYRVLLGLCGNTNAKPYPVGISRLEPTGNNERIVACRDFPQDVPAAVEIVAPICKGEKFEIYGWILTKPVAGANQPESPALIVERLEIEGPIDSWPPASYRKLFGDLSLEPKKEAAPAPAGKPAPKSGKPQPVAVEPVSQNPEADARRLLQAFLPRAFRRPVTADVVESYVAEARQALKDGQSFGDAMSEAYQSALCSPQFLFYSETPGPLDDYALASRLSYFLWRSMPDDALIAAAASGRLKTAEGLRAETERLLGDPKSGRFIRDFVCNWFELKDIDRATKTNPISRGADDCLWHSAAHETLLFFQELLNKDRSVLELIDSDWTMLNERLCQHYGLFVEPAGLVNGKSEPASEKQPLVAGVEFKLTKLPKGSHRGGVLTQASVLTTTADGQRTSPVLRGKWVCKKILGMDLPPPPQDVPAFEVDTRGTTTIREQLAKHRADASCGSCHKVIDPPGFALENFDPFGVWREKYNPKLPVDSVDVLPDGRRFEGVDQFKALLVEKPKPVVRNVARKLLTFATGAELQFADRAELDHIVEDAGAKRYGFRSLVHSIVQSRMFREK